MSQLDPPDAKPALASGRRLAGNTVWNLLGLGLPTLIAIVTIPFLIHAMGIERFGALTLAWMMVGYFSLFDMGLGRAMTQMIAKQLGDDDHTPIPVMFWTGMLLMTSVGLLGAGIMALIAPWLIGSVMDVSPELESEVRWGLYLVAIGLPIVVSSSGLRGVIEAHQHFRMVFFGKMLQGTVTFIGPLIAVQFTTNLAAAIGVLLCGRLTSWLMFFVACLHTLPEHQKQVQFDKTLIKPLATYGGWMTISNIIAPLLVYADRLIVGGMLALELVGYYTTPAEIVIKILILPNALLGVVFPVFAGTYARDPQRTARLFGRTMRYLYLAMLPVSLIGIGFAPVLLGLWLDHEFATNSFRVMQWMMIGILFNGLAHIPVGLIGAAGRPDITTKLHLIESPLYLVVLWLLVKSYGLEGAAIAWALRAMVDAAILCLCSGMLLKTLHGGVRKMIMIGGLTTVGLALLIAADVSDITRAGVSVAVSLIFAVVGWRVLLESHERENVLHFTKPKRWLAQ